MAYIDEGIDFTITKLCELCKTKELQVVSKYLQVKTSEGIKVNGKDYRMFSFHPKIRYNMENMYYVWIAVFNDNRSADNTNEIKNPIVHFYIFETKDVKKFDDFNLDTYQITDNQKTSLKINKNGEILDKGIKYNYDCFKEFCNNFKILEKF
ncbi:MAG: hypothetical protein LBC92_02845 [Rickettsiales bacterium]|jgi:hypothetical protein|nr:hypothetical protein [Rickettsiales bacterium]